LTCTILGITAPALADQPLRICIYGDNRGSSRVHRAILRQAKQIKPRLFVIAGDVLRYDYGSKGTPDAVLGDYRNVFGTVENSLSFWPSAPGPAIFCAPGGDDEQYFLSPEMAATADTARGKRSAYEGTSDLGMQLYDAFDLDQMRLRVQPLSELGKELPMSPYGDYLLIVGSGPRRDCAIMVLYRTDRWCFRQSQIDWVDSTLAVFRKESPTLPLIMVGHDWTWIFPDTLDDGRMDGSFNGVREGSPEYDQTQKRRLQKIMQSRHVDLAIASDRHAYWAGKEGALLKINCAAASCTDIHGERVALDNVWVEYSQTPSTIQVITHPVEPPSGCGLRAETAALGIAFEKNRTAGSVWRTVNP
jgi:hypothetical protein